jgi:hypothetical protein
MNTHDAVLAAREIGGAGEREPRSGAGRRVPAPRCHDRAVIVLENRESVGEGVVTDLLDRPRDVSPLKTTNRLSS